MLPEKVLAAQHGAQTRLPRGGAREAENLQEIILPSNSGNAGLRVSISDWGRGPEGDFVRGTLHIWTRIWTTEHCELDSPAAVSLEAQDLTFSSVDLGRVAQALRAWIDLPLGELRTAAPPAELRLTPGLVLLLGQRADVVWEPSHPCATVTYSLGAQCGEAWFVTDQTCIRMFVEGVEAVRDLAGTP